MKLLHISSISNAGAGLCATRINNALVKAGVESRMLVRDGKELPEGVEGAIAKPDGASWLDRHRLVQKGVHFANRFLPDCHTPYSCRLELNKALAKCGERVYTHLPFSNYKDIAKHPLVEWADVIHLHWVPEFVDYPTFFKQVKKPIVWTLHDMHPILGVMHYESEYTKRPAALDKIDAICKGIKRSAVIGADIHLVAISQMMKDLIANSDIMGQFPCELIHNGVDVNAFKRYEVPRNDGVTFLFSSYGIFDERKGLLRVVKALESLNLPKVTLLCVGHNFGEQRLPKSRINIRHLGFIADEELLSKIYSEADCFINASYEETFAQTITEAMACGTPVVSTPCGIAPELIRDFNGVVCDGFTVEQLAEGVRVFLSRRYEREEIRREVVENYAYDKIARQYGEGYGRVRGREKVEKFRSLGV